jgi:signal transduction histidine kinase
MFATGLTPVIVMGVFCFYTDYYDIPNSVRKGMMAIPFLGSFVHEGDAHLHVAVCVLLALASGIAIGTCSVLTARSITRPTEKARRMIEEMMQKGDMAPAFRRQQVFTRNEIGILLQFIVNTIHAIKLKQEETERKLLSLQETDRFKTEFISNTTYELRTRLTLILGPVTSLLDATPQSMSEEDVSFLKTIRDNALRLKKSISNLAAFSGTEVGGEQPTAPSKERVETEFVELKGIENEFDVPSAPMVEDDVTQRYPILLIEDDAEMKRYLYSVLKENFEPIFAANEYEVMERIKEKPVKLVIIDVGGKGCYELCRKVKDVVSPLFMPIVILTAEGDATLRIMGLEAGADCYITKPFEKRELLARLMTLLDQKKLFDAIHEKNTQLHRAEKLRSEFVTTVSHELRTPLSSILLASELLLDEISGKINEEQKKQLGIINLSCQNLLRLINNVLSLAKINAGELDINLTEIDLKKLIDTVLKEISPLAHEKGLHLQSSLYKIPVIMSDGDKIRQVLLNILSNAIKFTHFGGRIDIFAKIPEDPKMVEISIADNGIGIPNDALNSIFEEYRQVKDTENRNGEGVGLGLSITKKLVRLLGGEIWVRSKLKEGSVFSFSLPQSIENTT